MHARQGKIGLNIVDWACIMFVLLLVLIQPTTANACSKWSLEGDFRIAPHQANPNPDRCGNLQVWYFLQNNASTYPAHIPSEYTRLREFITDRFHIAGLESWQGEESAGGPKDQLPTVGINSNATTKRFVGIVWPPGTVLVHPLPQQFVVVGWKSPINGSISVEGGVRDLDNSCGNGILWFIDRFRSTNSTIASGGFPEGGSQRFRQGIGGNSLWRIAVRRGDFLFFIVDANGDHACDSTKLNIHIARKS